MNPPPASIKPSPRNIILCFDDAGNGFGENSNVVRFFRSLVKGDPEKQLVYYQPGISTRNIQRQKFMTRGLSAIVSAIDQTLVSHLDSHITQGYEYIMRNYRKGDNISLFGFSQGAHTARAIAGMLYKVGILPAHNNDHLDFAFSVYQTTGERGYALSKEFKSTFSTPVPVEFVGVWDTVSPSGIIAHGHPYTSVNYAVKCFRHALALDERRSEFRPNTWNEPTLEREQVLDVDKPDVNYPGTVPRDEWAYEPPNRDVCDVKEVWFSGCHADIGGGSYHDKINNGLSLIPLRWMIKECLINTDIMFDHEYLKTLGINLLDLACELAREGVDVRTRGFDVKALIAIARGGMKQSRGRHSAITLQPYAAVRFYTPPPFIASDALIRAKARSGIPGAIYDQLIPKPSWWFFEFMPMVTTYQKEDGTWVRRRMCNLGQGRHMPFFDDEIKVHVSVRERIEGTRDNQSPYTPAAYNWDVVRDSGMLTYVK